MNGQRPQPLPLGQRHILELAAAMGLDELRNAVASLTMELDRREGRQKYRLPAHVEELLN
jgi:hypothetical protein